MSDTENWSHGTLAATRTVPVDLPAAFAAWALLEHRRHWFAGPGWTELARSQDFRVGGSELAHGVFPDGTETIYQARYHRIDDRRLIYAFDMTVGGQPFSVSLASVEFTGGPTGPWLHTRSRVSFSLLITMPNRVPRELRVCWISSRPM